MSGSELEKEREREREEGSRALSHTNTSATQRAHIMLVNSLAAEDTSGVLGRKLIQRRDCREHDVYIKIKYCGICHSDLHQIRAEWDMSIYYPMVPGHEIVGVVESVGESVTKFKEGDRVGVGCFVDSCRECSSCKAGWENYCLGVPGKQDSMHGTYNCCLKDNNNELLFGGYSQSITVDENYVLSIPDSLPLYVAAPLLCAGITMYSPLSHFGCREKGPQMKVGIQGFGGLGQMGVKLAKQMGCHVTVLSTSASKQKAAEELGADFLVTSDTEKLKEQEATFDLIISTISANYDINPYFGLLKVAGTYCLVGKLFLSPPPPFFGPPSRLTPLPLTNFFITPLFLPLKVCRPMVCVSILSEL